MNTIAIAHTEIPFLGLHYFDEEHAHLFFGRDEQLRDLLAKLADSRFVTVIGSSGTGKSSLARAGLVPALRSGCLTTAGSRWRIIKTRPGGSPIHNLAQDLAAVFGCSDIELTLRRGPLGLADAARQCKLNTDENLLIMVDQFEEIFRYQREAADRQFAAEEAAALVKLLLEATARLEPAIFVLITMRSDYLGACAQFRDLPERINTGLYLIPRMRRDQLEEAITGPAAVSGVSFSPALVQKLLNDAGEDPDQLPVLQHALLRSWLNWKKDNNPTERIDFPHYEATGGLRNSLDNHAEEIYLGLNKQDQAIAEFLFRCLTERDPSNNDIRRPTQLSLIAAIAAVSTNDVRRVADAFRGEGVSFLTPTAPTELQDDTLLDITHESLIRKWNRLHGTRERKGWVQTEAELREQYQDLLKRARRAGEKHDLLRGADLNDAVSWRRRDLKPEWGLRYDPAPESFALVRDYIARSVNAEHGRKTRWRLSVALLAIVIIAGVSFVLKERADRRDEAERTKDELKEARIRTEEQENNRRILQEARDGAINAAQKATQAARLAKSETEKAVKSQTVATARQLASQAQALQDSPELSALLSLESLKRKPLLEAMTQLPVSMERLTRPLWTKDIMESKSSEERAGAVKLSPVGFNADSYPLLQFSGDSRYLAAVSSGQARVFEAANGHEVPVGQIPGVVDSLTWNGTQLYVLTGVRDSEDKLTSSVYAVSIPDGIAKQVLEQVCVGLCLLTPNGKYFMTTSLDRVEGQLYPLGGGPPTLIPKGESILAVGQAGEVIRNLEPQGTQFALFDVNNIFAGSGDGDPTKGYDLGGDSGYLAVAGSNGTIHIFKRQSKLESVIQLALPFIPVGEALSPDGRLIAIADSGGSVRIMDWAVQYTWVQWSHSSGVVAISFSFDGRYVASMDKSGQIRVLPAPTDVVNGQGRAVSSAFRDKLAFEIQPSAVGRIVPNLTASFVGPGRFLLIPGTTSQIFDTQLGRPILPSSGLDGRVMSVSPDGRYAGAVDPKGKIAVLDLIDGSAVGLDSPARVITLVVSPGGRYLAIRGARQWDIIDVTKGSTIDPSPLPNNSTFLAFSPDGRWALVTQTSALSQPSTVTLLRCVDWTVVGHWDVTSPSSALFSADGRFFSLRRRTLASSNLPPYLLIDTESMKDVTLELPTGVGIVAGQFSPDGRLLALATGEDHTIRIFDPHSRQLLKQIDVGVTATTLVFSHSSRYLALSSLDGTTRVLDVRSGVEVSRTVLDEKETRLTVQFSQDDRMLVIATRISSGASTGPGLRPIQLLIRKQHLLAEDLIREGCSRVSRNLTQAEWKTYLSDYEYEKTCPDLAIPGSH